MQYAAATLIFGCITKLPRELISLFFNIQEVLADRLRQEITRSSFQTFQLYVLRLIIWIAYFGLTGGSMFLIYIINERFLAALRVHAYVC